jgi:hypothetical protein
MRQIAPMLHKHAAAIRGGITTTNTAASAIFRTSIVILRLQFYSIQGRQGSASQSWR